MGDCGEAYPQCPFSVFQIIERPQEFVVYDDYEQQQQKQHHYGEQAP